MKIKRHKYPPRVIANLLGFIAFVLFSFVLSISLLVFVSIKICRFFGISLIWAIPISLSIAFSMFIASQLDEGGILRSKLPKAIQHIRPEIVKDVCIVALGTVFWPALVYVLTESTTITFIAGGISFVYFFFIQSAIRSSRTGLKFIPDWHAEQQKAAENLINALRLGKEQEVKRTFCLFLRPFNLIPHEYNLYRDEYIPLEERIAETIQRVCPVIAVGRELSVGPGYITSRDWQEEITLLMKYAAVILVLPDQTPGMAFEIAHIIENSHIPKTLFVGPPAVRNTDHWEVQWEEITALLESAGYEVPKYRGDGLVFYYSQDQSNPIVRDLSGDIRSIECMNEFIRERLKLSDETTRSGV